MTVPSEGERAEPQLVFHSVVTGNYFDVLGVKPVIGRLFNDEDNRKPGAHPYAVLSYALWRNRFGGDWRVVGKTIRLNGSPFTVIGVAAAGFAGTSVGNKPDLFVPVMMQGQINPEFPEWNTRHFWWLNVLGRLKPGISCDQARAELDVLIGQIEANDPERRPIPAYDTEAAMGRKAVVLPGGQGFSYFRNEVSKPLIVLMIIVGSVLLIACANVANLLLARAAGRQREIAIRLAIGAGRMRLLSQLVVEGLLVGLAGGAAGLLFAQWGAKLLIRLMPSQLFPPQIDASIDWRLLAFACAVSLFTGVLCGLAPALQATRPNLVTALKAETGGSGTGPRIGRFDLRRALVVGQVVLALLLVIGAGLFIRTLQNLRNVDAGFARQNVLLVRIDPGQVATRVSGRGNFTTGSWTAFRRYRTFAAQAQRRSSRSVACDGTAVSPFRGMTGSRTKSHISTSTRWGRVSSRRWASRFSWVGIFGRKTTLPSSMTRSKRTKTRCYLLPPSQS
jgi:predicted permease